MTPGMLEKVWVHFPRGCNQEVEVVIYHGVTQLIPQDDTETVAGNDFTYEITQKAEIKQGYDRFEVRAWSPGTSYQHKILVSFDSFSVEERDISETFLEKVYVILSKIGGQLGVR